jgi:hypothetical protein
MLDIREAMSVDEAQSSSLCLRALSSAGSLAAKARGDADG